MEQPLATLAALKGKKITVLLKGNKEISGILIAYDLSTNITLEIEGKHQLIQGNTVTAVFVE